MSHLGRLAQAYIDRNRGAVTLIVVASLVSAVVELAFPQLLEIAIDSISIQKSGPTLQSTILWMLVAVLIGTAAHVVNIFLESRVIANGSFALRSQSAESLLNSPLDALRSRDPNRLAYTATGGVNAVEEQVFMIGSRFIFDALVAVGALAALMNKNFLLGAGGLILYGISFFITQSATNRIPAVKRRELSLIAQMSSFLAQRIADIRSLRSANAEAAILKEYAVQNGSLKRLDTFAGSLHALCEPVWSVAHLAGTILVAAIGGSMVMNGRLTLGAMVACLAYLDIFAGPACRFSEYIYAFTSIKGLATSLPLGDQSEKPPTSRGYPVGTEICVSGLELKLGKGNITYPAFQIEPGEKVAIVGPIGSGKSSLLDLLAGLRRPINGLISLGGADLQTVPVAQMRSMIGYAPQGAHILHGSVYDNIACGAEYLTQDMCLETLKRLGGSALIGSLPQGISTLVGPKGHALSGGQGQLILLARAACRKPDILLLDEPTSAMDSRSADLAIHGILDLFEGKTIVLVTHDAAQLRHVDRVIHLGADPASEGGISSPGGTRRQE